jgi:hypothetical protein
VTRTYGKAEWEKRANRKRKKKLDAQMKTANTRAKYGPTMKPAPVIVKRLETDEIVGVIDQSRLTGRRAYSEVVERKAREAGYASYAAYLRSPHWLALREAVFSRDRHRCRRCGAVKNLVVHHRYYGRLGAESMSSLTTLCGPCHIREHPSSLY